MGSLSGIFHTATSALTADQTALTATAQNISNQTTAGYARRAVNWSEGDTVQVNSSTSPGVRATVVVQRNAVLQHTVQNSTSDASASSAHLAALNALQSVFALNSSGQDAAGLSAAVNNFFNSASTLAASPNDSLTRQTMLANAQTLATTFNHVASQLAAQTQSLNASVTASVGKVNDLLSQFAALNQDMVQTTPGADTSQLQDQREQVLTQLSGLIDVNASSNSDGTVSLSLSDGTPLMNSTAALPLATAMTAGTIRLVANTAAGGVDKTAVITGGSIGGMLAARDGDIPAVRAQMDALAGAISNAVNLQNAAGTDANGNPGAAIFSGTTAATLQVVAFGAGAIAASANGSNAAAMGDLQNAALINGGTLTQSLSATIAGLGRTTSAAQTRSTADAALLTQAQTQRDAFSGLSLDTEAANLTQYQRAYQAAAKVLSIVNELMAQAINLGTNTTVS